MFLINKLVLGTLAMISYFFMFIVIIRFFDAMNLVNGATMIGVWLLTLALLYLADHQPGKKAISPAAV
jgi:hypothetical protein